MSSREKDPFEGIPLEEPPGFLDQFDPRMLVGIAAGAMLIVLVVGFAAFFVIVRPPQSPAPATFTPSGPTLTPSATAELITTTVPVVTLPSVPTLDSDATHLAATITNLPDLRFANLSEIVGIIRIRSSSLPDWTLVERDLTILPGTSVLTDENSSVKITLSDGSIVRLGSQTQFALVEMSGTNAAPVSILQLDFGKLWAMAPSLFVGTLEVRMPVGVAAVRGTFMSAEHNTTDKAEIVTCLEGRCWYENSNGGVELTTNQQTESVNGNPPSAPHRMDRNQIDDWDRQKIPEVLTLTPTRTLTNTPTKTFTPSLTFTASNTFTPSATVPTNTPTATFTPTKTFTATATATATFTATVTPGPPSRLGFTIQPPSSVTSGAPFSVRVSIQDAFGVTVPYAGATVNLAIGTNPGGGVLGGTASVGTVNGVADFPNLSIDKSGTGYTLVASATGLSNGTSVAFNVLPGPAVSLVVTGIPPTVTAGVASNVTVTARDANGNIALGYLGTIAFSSSDPSVSPSNGLPPNYTFTVGDAGVHTFIDPEPGLPPNYTILKTAGLQSVRATDTLTTSITGVQSGINVVHGPGFRLLVTGVGNPICVGVPSSVTVTVKDEFGNTVTNYLETITFSSSDGAATLPSDYTFRAGDGGTVTLSSVIFRTENVAPGHTVTVQSASGPFIWGEQTSISVCP